MDLDNPPQASTSQSTPMLTIRGLADGRKLEEAPPKEQQEPIASTSDTSIDLTQDVGSARNAADPTPEPAPTPASPPRKRTTPWGLAEYGIAEPDLSIAPNPAVEAKLRHFHTLRAQGIHFNSSLQSNKSFRNPSILSKLVDFVNVDEKLSAFPPEVWSSSSGLGREAWAESIAEAQKEASEEKQKNQERGKRSAIDFAPSTSSTTTMKEKNPVLASAAKKEEKRSRWDSGGSASSKDGHHSRRRDDGRDRDRDRDRGYDRHRDRSRSPKRR